MRGSLLNPVQGFEHTINDNLSGFFCSFQEVAFWMWRVAGVRLNINVRFRFRDPEEDDPDPFELTRDYVCQRSVLDDTPRTEKDQAGPPIFPDTVSRRGYGNGIDGISSLSTDSNVFDCKFGFGASHNSFFPIETNWVMGFSFLLFYPFSASKLTIVPESGLVNSGIALTVLGFDVRFAVTHLHTFPLYASPSEGTFSGSVQVYSNLFYEWRDPNGNPFWNSSTGAQIG